MMPSLRDLPGSSIAQDNILSILERANYIASMTHLEDLLEQMLTLMLEISGATNGTLYLLDREAGELVFKVIVGDEGSRDMVGMRIKEGIGIVGSAVQQAKPIVIDDLASDPRWYRDIDPVRTAHLRNAITFPLLLRGKPIGAVQIFNFVHAELELLQVLGNRMASEVDKVQLLEQTKHSNKRLQALVEMLGQIGAILDRDQLLQLLTQQASQLLEAKSGRVFLVDRTSVEDSLLLYKSSQSQDAPIIGIDADQQEQMNFSHPEHSFKSSSAISVPLRARPITVGKERSKFEESLIGNFLVLDKRAGDFNAEDTQLLEILASQASTVLQIAEIYSDANELFLDFIKVLASTIDAKDPYTRGHSQRVSDLSVMIAQKLGLNGDTIHDLRIGSLLHDIGKIGVPDKILVKPTRLTNKEYDQIKKHPGIGYKIMSQVHLLHNVLPAIIEHHERLDGCGYPLGLQGDQISLFGRIVAVADVFDAITTDRPYRKAIDIEAGLDYLKSNISVFFDGYCVHALASQLKP
jgi:putative nucleotidyltransferase with HDIG domain